MPAGLESWPRRVRAPAGVRKRRKATVKKRRNTAPGFKALDPKYFHEGLKSNVLTKNNTKKFMLNSFPLSEGEETWEGIT